MDEVGNVTRVLGTAEKRGALSGKTSVLWLAISSYRNDEEVLKILDQAHGSSVQLFDRILVVDSEGTGAVPRVVKDRGWERVIYRSYDANLGSGANLRERLRIAAEGGADYVYAMNHDGHVDFPVVATLLETSRSIENLGAAYPLGYFSSVGLYNLTGTSELPLSRKLVRCVNSGPLIDVFWSSSNGALYSMEPVRRGVLPWEAMWMAWEDLEYGWRLHDHGYRQVIVCSAVFQDNQEYVKSRLGHVLDKPPWRTYYFSRNLILAIHRSRNRPLFYLVAASRFLLESGLILLV